MTASTTTVARSVLVMGNPAIVNTEWSPEVAMALRVYLRLSGESTNTRAPIRGSLAAANATAAAGRKCRKLAAVLARVRELVYNIKRHDTRLGGRAERWTAWPE